MNDDNKKNGYLLDDIISPIFGHDYQNRIIENKNLAPHSVQKQQSTEDKDTSSYLEKQIEEELETKNKIAKVKEYETDFKTNTDVLKQYQKEKEAKQIQDALPSNYLNFRDSLEKVTDDLSIDSDFNATTEVSDNSVSNISEIIDDLFTK